MDPSDSDRQPPPPVSPPSATPQSSLSGMRIGDADRERVAERLNQAVADGQISLLELDERLAKAYAAKYEVELQELVADLPGGQLAVPPSMTKPVAQHGVAPYTAGLAALPTGSETMELRTGLGGLKRSGSWLVPPRLNVRSGMGAVKLDFTGARFTSAVVQIDMQIGAGSVKLRVPAGSTIDLSGLTASLGSVRTSVGEGPPDVSGPHFVVCGRVGVGSVKVSSRRW